MFSDNRRLALEEYVRFMDQEEPTLIEKELFEEVDSIGEYETKGDTIQNLDANKTLDGILRRVVDNEEDFQRIKSGSRKRFLKDYKIRYGEPKPYGYVPVPVTTWNNSIFVE